MANENKMKVHLFDIEVPENALSLADTLAAIEQDDLSQRVRRLFGIDYRVENIVPPSAQRPFWLLDVIKFRSNGGPGKATRGSPVESIDMELEQDFTEDTAVLIDAEKGYAIVQYNHHGPRSTAIAGYLATYLSDVVSYYEFRVVLTKTAQARLRSKHIFSSLEIQVAPALLSNEFKQANQSLYSALKSTTNPFNAETVTLIVKTGREKGKTLALKRWMKGILGLASEKAVESLKIRAKTDDGDRIDEVDLLKEKLEHTFPDVAIDRGRRLVQSARWDCLIRAYNGWSQDRMIR